MITSAFKQLCLVGGNNDATEVGSALSMADANAAQLTVVVLQWLPIDGVVTVVLEQSNDRENWTPFGPEPSELEQCGFYVLEPYVGIGTAAIRVRASLLTQGHDVTVILAVDVSLVRL
jgi:hypothetical protein